MSDKPCVVNVRRDEDEDEGPAVPMHYGYRYELMFSSSAVYRYAEPTENSDGKTFGRVYLVDKDGNVNPKFPVPTCYYGRHLTNPQPITPRGE